MVRMLFRTPNSSSQSGDWLGQYGRMLTNNYCCMEQIIITMEELNAAISTAVNTAVNAALDARERAEETIYLSRKATAKRLKINVSTLWRWAKTGYLTPIRRGGRILYPERDVIMIEGGESAA